MRTRALAVVATLGVVLGCSSAEIPPPRAQDGTPAGTPADRAAAAPSGTRFWVDPRSKAAEQAEQWAKEGRDAEAALLRRIADQPVAEWLDDQPAAAREEAAAVTGAAARQGRAALLVAYNIPHRDCGLYSTGGAADAAAYRAWIDAVAEGIGDSEATVILEPDAVPHLVDGCTPEELHAERYDLLAYAARRLEERPATTVYLDAGNPTWIKNLGKLAKALRRAGIASADGFSLNVSNFHTTETATAYGRRLSKRLSGAHFVIDTSRNGNGPLTGTGRREAWCNPPGRALGTPPTTRTGSSLVDAYLWIKRPGDSDGECRGGPPAGQWWPRYALTLSRNAKS